MSKPRKPRIAICYDFDGTLAAGNMQEHQFIPDIGTTKAKFWAEVKELAKEHSADEILAYMSVMLKKADAAKVSVRREDFRKSGKSIELFPGVQAWFDLLNAYGNEKGVMVEHHIISSGNAEIIAGTSIAKKFKKIYASAFIFDQNGVACWPALAVNYTNKTQFLFRINKDALEVYDKSGVNKFVPENDRPVPFQNMVFIGDGETDVPCFRLLKDKGGLAVAVYQSGSTPKKRVAEQLLAEGRVSCAFPADYSAGKDLMEAIKAKIDEVAARTQLVKRMK
jgi:hypothetical protein